ncbi:ribonuclease H [Candidatus Pacearchaeota archaeon CG10_big_fil_rev_8_21_14_0_10_34_12]|nr:MAG: ribonuclease H [Candidatus Pacearchaeota archaeon CG10_big_fil_rev_8_21_14_0_10_34_12]
MIFTNSDGGSRGNPGPAAIGVLIRKDDSIIEMHSEKIGNATNNEAEYAALIRALQLAATYTKDEVTCILDSELIVKQLLGEYKVKNTRLMKLFLKVQNLQDNFRKINYKHVKREDSFQQMVDSLLNLKLDEK